MKPEEIKRILDLCRAAGVAGVEIGPDSIKASFFPPFDAPPISHEEPNDAVLPKTPDASSTMAALMAQAGR